MGRLSSGEFKTAPKLPVRIILDNIRSHHNIGSVFRTSDAFRIEHIYLCGITARPPHREIHKTALGATESVDWSYYAATAEAIELAKRDGYTVVAIEQTNECVSLPDFQPSGAKLALVFGNEVNGVDDTILKLVDAAVEIPQFGTKHSFNISVCAGIALYDLAGKLRNLLP